MQHVILRDCALTLTERGLTLVAQKAEVVDGPRQPGEKLNHEFVRTGYFCARSIKLGGTCHLGDLHVGVCGMPVFDGSLLRCFINNDDVYKKMVHITGEPHTLVLTPARGWTAPRSSGKLDGGAAGILTTNPLEEGAIEKAIAQELVTEIGLIVRVHPQSQRRISNFCFEYDPVIMTDEFRKIRQGAWQKNRFDLRIWDEVKFQCSFNLWPTIEPKNTATVKINAYHDAVVIAEKALIAFERENATVEIMKPISITTFNPDVITFNPVDLELGRDEVPINRVMALTVYNTSGKAYLMMFYKGHLVDAPLQPVSKSFLQTGATTKYATMHTFIVKWITSR